MKNRALTTQVTAYDCLGATLACEANMDMIVRIVVQSIVLDGYRPIACHNSQNLP